MSGEPPEEEWRPIPGWETRYEVSSHGRVRSLMFRKKVRATPKIMSPTRAERGYLTLRLCADGRQVAFVVSRLVLLAFVGPPPVEASEAAHDNGDTSNNRLSNLAWKTPLENTADKYRHGTVLFGERHQNAKLTDADVKYIRESRHISGHKVAAELGVSFSLVYQIRRGKIWPHVGPLGTDATVYSSSKSGVRGVSKSRGRWVACIQVNSQRFRLGAFDDLEAAAAAYATAAKQHFGEFAKADRKEPSNG